MTEKENITTLEEEKALENENIEEQLLEEEIQPRIKLDYTLETPQERNELVKKIVESTPPEQLTNRYLEILADYIIFSMDKEERKKKKILTNNRMVTVNRRETSFEGLVGKFENGEDGIYNIITNDKNMVFTPKVEITPKDIEEIPHLKELKAAIDEVNEAQKKARGRKKFLLKKQVIEMCQQQYIIKNLWRKPIYTMNMVKSFSSIDFSDKITIDENQEIHAEGLSFFNPSHISILLCNYSKLKQDSWGKLSSDGYYMMEDLDNLTDIALKDYPLYYSLLIYKIDGKTNKEIQELLEDEHGVKYTVEYISVLWRNKIPKLIAEAAEKEYLTWYYTMVEKGKWKKCSRCGQIKLANNKFFSKNKTSKDGWYSICKSCRNKKKKK